MMSIRPSGERDAERCFVRIYGAGLAGRKPRSANWDDGARLKRAAERQGTRLRSMLPPRTTRYPEPAVQIGSGPAAAGFE